MSRRMIGSRFYDEQPKITVRPVRWNPSFNGFKRPSVFSICGIKDSGKSMLNEAFALRHPMIIDLMSSKDNESLCWIRDNSPIDDALLIVGDNVDLECSWEYKQISEVTLNDILDHEVTVTCNSFYHNDAEKFLGIQKITNILYNRLGWKIGNLIFIIIRESNSFLYSRTKQGIKMKDAKADFIFFTRELRHFGCSVGIDLLRWTGTDRDLRDNSEFTIFKQIGSKTLPQDKKYLYGYFHPFVFSQMKPWNFVLERMDGSLGWGRCPELPFHKEEGVNLLTELGIEITMGEPIIESTMNKIGDREHEQIVRAYIEMDPKSMGKLAKAKHLSKSTVSHHVSRHNKEIETDKKCSICHRLGSDISTTPATNLTYKRKP